MDREKSNSKILQDLGERVKELGALHKTARILQDGSRSISEMMTMIVNLLPDAWQYPEITTARIKYQDLIFTTDNFQKSEWYQKTSFKLRSGETGSIEIYYLKEMPELYEARSLLRNVNLLIRWRRCCGFISSKKSMSRPSSRHMITWNNLSKPEPQN
jgi:hypothetical protein